MAEDSSTHLVLPLIGGREQPGPAGRGGLNRPQQGMRHKRDVEVVAADRACRRHSAGQVSLVGSTGVMMSVRRT